MHGQGYLNAKTLETAISKDKKIIQELRETLRETCQIKKEQAGRLKLIIDYQL